MNSRLVALVLMALGAAGWNAQAQWGSIHGNNHSSGGEHGAARGGGREEHGAGRVSNGGEHRGQPAPVEHREAPAVHGEPNRHEAERHEDEHRGWVAPSRESIEHDTWDRRHWDLDEERRHAYFWSDYSVGMPVVTLPQGYLPIRVGGVPYDYYDGVFYQPGQAGYIVVAPPPGALVPTLPPGAEALVVGAYTYYYAGGAFYVQQPQGFQVVPPPLGISVPYLPAGSVPVNINGVLYYQAGGVYFLPQIANGATVFTVVQP